MLPVLKAVCVCLDLMHVTLPPFTSLHPKTTENNCEFRALVVVGSDYTVYYDGHCVRLGD